MDKQKRAPGVAMALLGALSQEREAPQRARTRRVIGEKEIADATARLMKYKAGKASLDQRVTENEEWWRMRQWQDAQEGKDEARPASAWLFNVILNKHADAMDNYPEPAVLPRSRDDQEDAKKLSSVLPVVLEQCGYEAVYDRMWWRKLKGGTGVQGVFWDPDAAGGTGDICVRDVDILNLYWEPGITDIQQSRDVFCVAVTPLDKLRAAYPAKAGDIVGGAVMLPEDYRHDDAQQEMQDCAVVVDWYYKRVIDGRQVLHYCKYAGNVVLYASENDPAYATEGYYAHGQYPFVLDPLFPLADSPAGMGYIDILKDPQAYIDQMDGLILKNAYLAGRPRFFVRESAGVNEEEFTDWGKDIVHTTGNLGEEAVRQIQVNALPQSVYEMLSSKINELKQVSGNDDFTRGSAGSGVTAASAIAALQEAGSKLSRDMIKSSYRAFTRVCELCVELIRQFYTEPREFRILGEDGQESFEPFSSAGMQPRQVESYGMESSRQPIYDIKIRAQKSSPFSRIAQNEIAKELYQMGVFAPQNADQAVMVLDMMDFEGKSQVLERVRHNGSMFQQMQQMQAQMQQMAAVIDGLTGAGLTETMEQPQAGGAAVHTGGGVSGSSPLTRAVEGGAGTTATAARDRAQAVAKPK